MSLKTIKDISAKSPVHKTKNAKKISFCDIPSSMYIFQSNMFAAETTYTYLRLVCILLFLVFLRKPFDYIFVCCWSSAVALCSPHKRTPTNTGSNPCGKEIFTRNLAPLIYVLHTSITYVDPAVNEYHQTFLELWGK